MRMYIEETPMTNTVNTMMQPAVNEGTTVEIFLSGQESPTRGAKSHKKMIDLI